MKICFREGLESKIFSGGQPWDKRDRLRGSPKEGVLLCVTTIRQARNPTLWPELDLLRRHACKAPLTQAWWKSRTERFCSSRIHCEKARARRRSRRPGTESLFSSWISCEVTQVVSSHPDPGSISKLQLLTPSRSLFWVGHFFTMAVRLPRAGDGGDDCCDKACFDNLSVIIREDLAGDTAQESS